MAPTQDRVHTKIAELEARGISGNAAPSRAMGSRPKPKAFGVVVPAFRSVEEVCAPLGATLFPRVDIYLDPIPIELPYGSKTVSQAEQGTPTSVDGSTINFDVTLNARVVQPFGVGFAAAVVSNPEVADPTAMSGLLSSKCPQQREPSSSADGPAPHVLPWHPLRGPLPSPSAGGGEVGQAHGAATPDVLQPSAPGLSYFKGADVRARTDFSAPTVSKTSTESTASGYERSAHERGMPLRAPCNIQQDNSKESKSMFITEAFLQVSSQLPHTQPQTAPQSCTPSESVQLSAAKVPSAQPPPIVMTKVPKPGSPRHMLKNSSVTTSFQSKTSGAADQKCPGPAHDNSYRDTQVGCGVSKPAARSPNAVMGHQLPSVEYDLQQAQYNHQLQRELLRQQLLQAEQCRRQYVLHQECVQQLQQPRSHLQQETAMHQLRHITMPRQSRPASSATMPSASSMHPMAERPRPPQRPRPCAAFGADVKGIEASLVRALTSFFRKEPRLFRTIYGFDLDWWIEARGKPLADTRGDLLVVMLFHNYAVVSVRMDRCAAPTRTGEPLLNPIVSTLLNQRIYGNALLLKVFKVVGRVDGGRHVVGSCGGAVEVSTLTPEQVHACVQESDNVAWQVDWYRDLAPSLAESLASDERGTWLSRLPLAPLDEQGNPDLREALALVKKQFRVQLPAVLNKVSVRSEAEHKLPGGGGSTTPAAPSESRRDAAEATKVEDSKIMISTEVVPLLRALRCTSPWCNPALRRPEACRDKAPACPFGHFWRSISFRGTSSARRPLVFDAVRPCASKTLEPKLCSSLLYRLSQMKRSVRGVRNDIFQVLNQGPFSNGDSIIPNADGIVMSGTGDRSEEGFDTEDKVAEGDDDCEELPAVNPPAGRRDLRLDDLTFYLSFCRDGPRCGRCHSYHELKLVEALQRLNGSGRPAESSLSVKSHDQGRAPRRGFEVLAALSDVELHGQDDSSDDPSRNLADSDDSDVVVTVDGELGGGGTADGRADSPPVASLLELEAAVGPDPVDGSSTCGTTFNWADELEATDPAPEAAAPRPRRLALQPAVPKQLNLSSRLVTRAPRSQKPMHGQPPPIHLSRATGSGTGWGSRAPLYCPLPGEAPGSTDDRCSLPSLPETLDLEPLVVSDHKAVPAPMVAKSRSGVYVPPHLRTPMGNEVGASEQDAALQAEILLAGPPQDTVEADVNHSASLVAQPTSLPPLCMTPLRTGIPPGELHATMAQEPLVKASKTAAVVLPSAWEDYIGLPALKIDTAYPLPAGAMTPLAFPAAPPPLHNHDALDLQRFGICQPQPPQQLPDSTRFFQPRDQGQAQELSLHIPVPIPVPLTTLGYLPAQLHTPFGGPPVVSSASAERWETSHVPSQAPRGLTENRTEGSGSDIDDILSDCMSLCGISLPQTSQGPSPSSRVKVHTAASDTCNLAPRETQTIDGRMGTAVATVMRPVAHYPQLQTSMRPDFLFHSPLFALTRESVAAPIPLSPVMAALPPEPSFPQAGLPPAQSFHVPTGFAPCPYGVGVPFYGFNQWSANDSIPASIPAATHMHGYPPPLLPYVPPIASFMTIDQ